jgi:hypothetical protein
MVSKHKAEGNLVVKKAVPVEVAPVATVSRKRKVDEVADPESASKKKKAEPSQKGRTSQRGRTNQSDGTIRGSNGRKKKEEKG